MNLLLGELTWRSHRSRSQQPFSQLEFMGQQAPLSLYTRESQGGGKEKERSFSMEVSAPGMC